MSVFIQILPYIGALIGAIGGVISLVYQFKINKQDESHKLFDDALKLKNDVTEMYNDVKKEVDANKLELERLSTKVEYLRKRVSYLRNGIDILIKQIIEDAKLTPAWIPNDEEDKE